MFKPYGFTIPKRVMPESYFNISQIFKFLYRKENFRSDSTQTVYLNVESSFSFLFVL